MGEGWQNAAGALEHTVDRPTKRREFFKAIGLGGALLAMPALPALVTACDNKNNITGFADSATLDFASDVGVLNYAYALEQLEAAFYTQVASSFAADLSASERTVLTDIRDHEIIHRDFFKATLGADAIGNLEVNFSSINFSSRASVLGTAKAFEDLGVSAYNGAARRLKRKDYLLLAGKIVSVEARHAAAIRDLLNLKSADFAGDDVVLSSGFDVVREPGAVLAIAGAYIKTPVTVKNLSA